MGTTCTAIFNCLLELICTFFFFLNMYMSFTRSLDCVGKI